MSGFIVKNPNGVIIAAFLDRGLALKFCHQCSYPEAWVKEADIQIKIK